MKIITPFKCLYLCISLFLSANLLLGQNNNQFLGDPPENFYVTPIGMATWDSITADDFQFYKVFLNGGFICDTEDNSYVFGTNAEELISGESYLAEIAVLYNDGLSETTAFTFTYLPCDSFPAHSGFNGYEENNELHFYWDPVEDDMEDIYMGTHFYFEDIFMDFIPATDTFYTFGDPGPGYYTYCFYRVYSNDNGLHSWETCLDHACEYDAGYPPECDPPRNLTAWDSPGSIGVDIHLEWDAPNSFDPVWLQYDDGINVDGIGGPAEFSYAAKWDPEQLNGFDIAVISKVNFFPRDEGSLFTLKIWKGDNASTLLYEQNISDLVFDEWNEIELNENIPIDISESLWVGFYVQSNEYPAGVGNYTGHPNSDLMTLDGILWEHLSDYGLDNSWNLAVYCEGESGKTQKLIPNADHKIPYKNKSAIGLGQLPKSAEAKLSIKDPFDLVGYIIYRNNIRLTEDTIQATNYIDTNPSGASEYCYRLTAVYEDWGQSEATEEACVSLLAVKTTNLSTKIYPNPAQHFIKIESPYLIKKIQMMNYLGQIIYTHEAINSNHKLIDLNDFNKGVYIIEVNSFGKIEKHKIIIK